MSVTTVRGSSGVQAPSEAEMSKFFAIREKQLAGKQLTEEDRAVVGKVLEASIDMMDIEGNESLRTILRLMAKDGKLTAEEQGYLRDGIEKIADLPNNPELAAHLRQIRAQGKASDADIEKIIALAGKLSIAEENAAYASLMSVSLAQGVSEAALQKWAKFSGDESISRMKHAQKAGWVAKAKQLGLMALTMLGFAALAMLAPWGAVAATIGSFGARAIQVGAYAGSYFGMRAAGKGINKQHQLRLASYGVMD